MNIKPKIPPEDLATVQPPMNTKAYYGKPVSGISLEEFNRSLCNQILPVDQLLVIYSLTNSSSKTETKKPRKNSKNQPISPPSEPLSHLPQLTPKLTPLLSTIKPEKKTTLLPLTTYLMKIPQTTKKKDSAQDPYPVSPCSSP